MVGLIGKPYTDGEGPSAITEQLSLDRSVDGPQGQGRCTFGHAGAQSDANMTITVLIDLP